MQYPFLDNRSLAQLCSLKGRVAVITGASKGIGNACARRLAEAGASIVLFDIDIETAEKEAIAIAERYAVKTLAVHVNMTDTTMVRNAIDKVLQQFGELHIWINNAGIFPEISSLDITDENYDQLLALDQRAAFLAMRDAAKVMLNNKHAGAVIINMVSVSGLIAATNSAHYVAAKHAISGATKAFARDLAPHGIRVLAIAPTLISTPGVKAGLSNPHGKEVLEAIRKQIPLGRAGQPDEVARVVYFAASDLSAFMTGTTIVVDGGELVL